MLISKIVTGGPIVVYGIFTGGLSTCNREVYEKDVFPITTPVHPKNQDRTGTPKEWSWQGCWDKRQPEELQLEFNYLYRALPNVSIFLHSHNVPKVIVVHCISRKWRKEDTGSMLKLNLNFNTKCCTTEQVIRTLISA